MPSESKSKNETHRAKPKITLLQILGIVIIVGIVLTVVGHLLYH